MKRSLYILFAVALAMLSAASCNKGTTVTISPEKVRVGVGYTIQVNATVKEDGNIFVAPSLRWEVGDASIASINEKGEVSGLKEGETVLYAYYENYSAQAPLTVQPALKNLQFSKSRINTRTIGDKIDLTEFLESEPENAYIDCIKWSLSDRNVAEVDQQGLVTALARGNTPVTATAIKPNGGTLATTFIQFHVLQPVPPGYVDLDLPSGTLWSVDDSPMWHRYKEALDNYRDFIPTKAEWEELVDNIVWTFSDIDGNELKTQEEVDAYIEREYGQGVVRKFSQIIVDYENGRDFKVNTESRVRFRFRNGKNLDIKLRNYKYSNNPQAADSAWVDVQELHYFYATNPVQSDVITASTLRYVLGGEAIKLAPRIPMKATKVFKDWDATLSDHQISYEDDGGRTGNNRYYMYVRTVLRD